MPGTSLRALPRRVSLRTQAADPGARYFPQAMDGQGTGETSGDAYRASRVRQPSTESGGETRRLMHSHPRGDGPGPGDGPLPRGRETVLVVDEDEAIRGTVLRTLRGLGYRAVAAAETETALDMARASEIGLLLVDLVLPEMSGLDLAREISEIRPGAPILYMSGLSDDALLREVRGGDPGVGFLPKPFSPRLLATRVRELLDASSGDGASLPAEGSSTRTLLVVDEDPQRQGSLAGDLERLGYRVLPGDDRESVRIRHRSEPDPGAEDEDGSPGAGRLRPPGEGLESTDEDRYERHGGERGDDDSEEEKDGSG